MRTRLSILSVPVWLRVALATLILFNANIALAQGIGRNFDHLKTGYPLTGIHAAQRCEACHVNGVFRGTPRTCESCHVNGARLAGQNIVKPLQHMPTQLPCDSCHGTVTFSNARFNHMGVAPAACGTCHNGMTATGKPAGHVPTTASCGTCHRTTAWVPAGKPDHSMFTTATLCASCHNGASATGKPANHIATAGNCIDCHRTSAWLPAGKPDHNMFTTATLCVSCHNGSSATGKPANHIATTGNCIDCHRTSAWLPASKPDHNTFTAATNCASCHNGSSATGKPANHMPTTVNCYACHSPTRAAFTPHSWNHTQQPVVAQCATCHTGSYLSGMGKPANHIPYQLVAASASANCDTCHKSGFSTWFPGRFHANVTVTSQCTTCHGSPTYGLTVKPVNHIPVVQLLNGSAMDCSACHKTTTSWSVSVSQMNHNGSLGKGSGWCIACHATGTNYLGTMMKMALTHRGTEAAGKTDCSDSSCHRPLGTFGAAYTKWN